MPQNKKVIHKQKNKHKNQAIKTQQKIHQHNTTENATKKQNYTTKIPKKYHNKNKNTTKEYNKTKKYHKIAFKNDNHKKKRNTAENTTKLQRIRIIQNNTTKT